MLFYIARRLAWTVLVLLVVMMVTFAVFFLMPSGDPALRFAGKTPTDENLALIHKRLHLDKPWYIEFGYFVKNFAQGDENGWPGSATRTATTSRCAARSSIARRARSG